MLTREAILRQAEERLPVESVAVPEWGGDVTVRTITAKERDLFEAGCRRVSKDGTAVPKLDNLRGRLAALVISDEKGNRLFTDDDASMLGDLSVKSLERVLDAARRLNGMGEDSVEDAGGNSDAAP